MKLGILTPSRVHIITVSLHSLAQVPVLVRGWIGRSVDGELGKDEGSST